MMHITEDTPPDMLAGAMDLTVHLPNGRSVKMSVERCTPMMDVLMQITAAHHLQLSGYVIEALGMAPSSEHSDKVLPYKPNTPIGTLDTQHIRVVQKARTLPVPKTIAPGHQPFESTFRLKVHLPRKQLFVSRVSMNVLLEDIMLKVCDEKNLDPSKYEFRHPDNQNEVLDPKLTLEHYKITEIYVVSKGSSRLSQAFSASDIMALRKDEERKHSKSSGGVFNLIFKRGKMSNGSGSLSSDNRSISPTHSDDSRSVTPPAIQQQILKSSGEKPKAPQRKRRPAPKPPQPKEEPKQVEAPTENPKKNENGLTICHSRNSSDSSGYHEASILSDNANTSLPRRPQTMIISEDAGRNKLNGEHSKSTSNLASMSLQSKSISSLAFAGRKKKAPPPPPVLKTASSVTNLEKASPVVASPVEQREPTVPKHSEDPITAGQQFTTNSPPESIASSLATTLSSNIETDINLSKENSEIVENEPEEKTAEVTPPENTFLPIQNNDAVDEPEWQYRLPSPPTAFRDSSPTLVENLTVYESTEQFKSDSVVTSPELFEKLKLVKETQSVTSEEEKPIFNKLSLENLEKRKSLVYNRELATSLKYKDDDDSQKSESISSKRSSVMSELEEVISNSKSSTLNKNAKSDNFIHSDSNLPNFKITTYDMPKKKINIFEDDSIRSNENSCKFNAVENISSLLKKSYVGRSMENLALKKPTDSSGNRYKAKTLVRNNAEATVGRSESFNASNWVPNNPVKRSKSQVAINQYKEEMNGTSGDGSLSKSNSLFDVSGLQSLEVMRLIQTKLKTPSNSTDELDRKEPEKPVPTEVPENTQREQHQQHRYGPPSINLGTWSERPKSQITLKEDTDYKFNTSNTKLIASTHKIPPEEPTLNIRVNGMQPNLSIKVNGRESITPQPSGNVIIKIGGNEKARFNHTTAVGFRRPLGNVNTLEKQRPHSVAFDSNFDISRVPIVRSVELKKHFKDMHINKSITQICPQDEVETKSLSYSVNVKTNPIMRINSFSQNNQSDYTTNKNVPFSQVKLRRTDSNKNVQVVNNNNNNNIFGKVVLRNTSNRFSTGNVVEKPPPPPMMMPFVQSNKHQQNSTDPRDELLSAIRNFGGKRGLKSVKV